MILKKKFINIVLGLMYLVCVPYAVVNCIDKSTCIHAYILICSVAFLLFIINLSKKRIFSLTLFNNYNLKEIFEYKLTKKETKTSIFCACLITLMIVAANYYSYTNSDNNIFHNLFIVLTIVYCFIFAWYQITSFLLKLFNIKNEKKSSLCKNKSLINKFFFISWGLFSACYLLHIYLLNYPGIVNVDAWYQLFEIKSNTYDALYAYCHTQIIHFFYLIGVGIFNDIYITFILYCTVMSLFFAFCLSLIIKFLAEINVSKVFIIISILYFIMIPTFFFTSATMYSDLPFACCIIIFVITLFRVIFEISKRKIFNYVLLVVSSFGIALLRSNGVYVFLLMTIVFLIFFNKKLKVNDIKYFKIFTICLFVSLCSFIFLGPICSFLNVASIDPANFLTVPAQQVGRVIVDKDDLTEDQQKLVNDIVDIENVKGHYDKYVYDPLKNQIRVAGHQENFISNIQDYIKLYFDLGFKHPDVYLFSYIDTTSNYWNSNVNSVLFYDANITWIDQIYERTCISDTLYEYYYLYMQFYDDYLPVLQSIGLYFWLFLILFIIILSKKNWKLAYFYVPVMSIFICLFVSVPTDNQIRFVLSLFCLAPFFIATTFRSNNY